MRLPGFLIRPAFALLLLAPSPVLSWSYPLPGDAESVVGSIDIVHVQEGESLVDIARTHGVGFEAIRLANPGVDTWLPASGSEVLIPRKFVLPDAPREGIVVNVAEMRLYFFPPASTGGPPQVVTYPVSIGRGDWETPLRVTRVTRKASDPPWYPPESVRRAHVERGNPPLPSVVPPGPDNPLGRHALYLGIPSYLIHGTNRPTGIGMRVTHGCIRLYPEDIERLYEMAPVGTPVRIVNQPVKVGRLGDRLYLEVHPPFTDLGPAAVEDEHLARTVHAVAEVLDALPEHEADPEAIEEAGLFANGIPVVVNRLRVARGR